jgi:hypothetical protein
MPEGDGLSPAACCCGVAHVLPQGVARLIGELGPDVRVTVPGGSWLVPRVFIAAHGLKAGEVPALAAEYGWAAAAAEGEQET